MEITRAHEAAAAYYDRLRRVVRLAREATDLEQLKAQIDAIWAEPLAWAAEILMARQLERDIRRSEADLGVKRSGA